MHSNNNLEHEKNNDKIEENERDKVGRKADLISLTLFNLVLLQKVKKKTLKTRRRWIRTQLTICPLLILKVPFFIFCSNAKLNINLIKTHFLTYLAALRS